MFKRLKQWLRARKLRASTEREIKLLALLEQREHELATYKGHYSSLQQDFAALWDDHQILQLRYTETRYPKMAEWVIPRPAMLGKRS